MVFKLKETRTTSKCGEVTWVYPFNVHIHFYNPFTDQWLTKKWLGIVPAGGFHFCGIRCTWGKGNEIRSKRIIHNLGSS